MEKTVDVRAAVTDTNKDILDALVIGTGVTGIYALYRLQESGLNVRAVDKAGGVGGTWWWNRYPGARFDSDSYSYAYFFSRVLADEWEWSEHYAGQPEIERYFNFVVDRFDLRKNIRLNTEVKSARYDGETGLWLVDYADGEQVRTRFLVPATGMLSEPITPKFEGMEDFQGTTVLTARWPSEGVDLKGKRVAVIGTGSSGIQVATEIAKEVGSLTVFQRSGHWATPLLNQKFTPEEIATIREEFEALHHKRINHFGGFFHEPELRSNWDVSDEERLEKYEELYNSGGLRVLTSQFVDTYTDPKANRLWSEFVADKIRQRVNDKELAERLIPTDHGFGAYRPPKEAGYYEIFNQDNVHLVSVRETPIKTFTATGIETSEGNFEFDVVILATGFDAWLGTLRKIDIRNEDGLELLESWEEEGPKTLLGVGIPKFPNLLFVGGLHSLGGNLPAEIEHQVDWVERLIQHMKQNGYVAVETSDEAAEEWTQHVYELADSRLTTSENAWYSGRFASQNVKTLLWMGGLPAWRKRAAEIADSGYEGLSFVTRDQRPWPNTNPSELRAGALSDSRV